MTVAVEVSDVVKQYDTVRAVDGVSFSVRKGECFGLLGSNGAGKSTLIRMLATLEAPSSGTISCQTGLLYGRDDGAIRRIMGVALQETGLDPLMTGNEVLVLAGRLSRLQTRAALARAEELLTRFQLDEVAMRPIRTYSGGMRRRLDLAVALVHDPSVIVLDEPTTGLDPVNRALLWEFLRDLVHTDHKTVLLTTQYLEEADVLCDRLLFINHGRTVAEGSPADLKRAMGYSTIRFHVADWNQADIVAALRSSGLDSEVNASGIQVVSRTPEEDIFRITSILSNTRLQHLEIQPPSLDDVFRTLTKGKDGSVDAIRA